MAEPVNIVHELEVIRDDVQSGGFDFDDGYFGDAVRAAVHSALRKIDKVIGYRPHGGGEVDPPEPIELTNAYICTITGRIPLLGRVAPCNIGGLATYEEPPEIEEEEGE